MKKLKKIIQRQASKICFRAREKQLKNWLGTKVLRKMCFKGLERARASISQKHASLKSHSLLSCYNLFCLFTSSVWKEGFNLAKTCVFEISLTSFMLQPFFAFAFYMGQIKFQVSSTLLQLGQAPTVIPVFEDLLLLLPLSNSTFSWRLHCTYTKIELETGEALKMSFFPKKSASEFQGFLFFSRVCTFISLRGKPKKTHVQILELRDIGLAKDSFVSGWSFLSPKNISHVFQGPFCGMGTCVPKYPSLD